MKNLYIKAKYYLLGLYNCVSSYLLSVKLKIKGLVVKVCDYKIKLLKKIKKYCS